MFSVEIKKGFGVKLNIDVRNSSPNSELYGKVISDAQIIRKIEMLCQTDTIIYQTVAGY